MQRKGTAEDINPATYTKLNVFDACDNRETYDWPRRLSGNCYDDARPATVGSDARRGAAQYGVGRLPATITVELPFAKHPARAYVFGLDGHQVRFAQLALSAVLEQAVGLAQPGTVQGVAYRAGVGEMRHAHAQSMYCSNAATPSSLKR